MIVQAVEDITQITRDFRAGEHTVQPALLSHNVRTQVISEENKELLRVNSSRRGNNSNKYSLEMVGIV